MGSFFQRGGGQHRKGKAVVEGEALLTFVNASKLIASPSGDRGKEAGEGETPSLLLTFRTPGSTPWLTSHRSLTGLGGVKQSQMGEGKATLYSYVALERLAAHSGTLGFCPWEQVES